MQRYDILYLVFTIDVLRDDMNISAHSEDIAQV